MNTVEKKTNQTNTSGAASVSYKFNNRKINADKIPRNLQSTSGSFDLVVNNVKIQVTNKIRDIKVHKSGISIKF